MLIVDPPEQVDFAQNKLLLNRYRFVEYEIVRILAAWLPATPQFELKLALGRLLWEEAQHVQHLYTRLREVQTPAFRDPPDAALRRLMAEAIDAPTAPDMLAGLFRVIKPALADAYRWHMQQTFANPDAPTLYALGHILLDEDAHAQWAVEALADHPIGEWERYVGRLLQAAGGLTGRDTREPEPPAPALRTPFVAPRAAARDERFRLLDAASAPAAPKMGATDERLQEFESYSQEMLAAETVALVLYLSPGMPWEFVYNSARHCYDETRHCRLGMEWLAAHGLSYLDVPQHTRIFAWRSQYDPATQYCLLTMGNEKHVFPYRRRRLTAYREAGDRLSAEFLNYDMADERQHVAYGRKWLPQLMAQHGIDTPVERFVHDTVRLWEDEYCSGRLPIHRPATQHSSSFV